MSRLDDFFRSLPKIPGRPMLAGVCKRDEDIKFPMLGSMKIDGYRGIYANGVMFSRTGKVHPSSSVQMLAQELKRLGFPDGLDGELIVPDKDFHEGGGLLRRGNYSGPVHFIIFDIMQDGLNAQERFQFLSALTSRFPENCSLLDQVWLSNLEEMKSFENDCLASGGEGIVLRKPTALYKHGRGTDKDQIMLKIKRYKCAEALVLSVEPRMHNLNEMEENPLGYAERSSTKENLIPTDVLGKINVLGINGEFDGVEFAIGTFDGFSDEDKREWLKNPPINQVITYKYFPEGVKDRPRHPVLIDVRPTWDFSGEEVKKYD